jgi:hypothetical protein
MSTIIRVRHAAKLLKDGDRVLIRWNKSFFPHSREEFDYTVKVIDGKPMAEAYLTTVGKWHTVGDIVKHALTVKLVYRHAKGDLVL